MSEKKIRIAVPISQEYSKLLDKIAKATDRKRLEICVTAVEEEIEHHAKLLNIK